MLYLEPKHGLLASTFKVLIGLPLVILLASQEKQDMMKNTSVTNMRARTLPSQNACRVKADGMGSTYRRRISAAMIHSRLDHNGPTCVERMYVCKTLVIQLLCVQ